MTAGGSTRWHPLYRTWLMMKTRCYNRNFHKFKDYGARGIRVCDRWRHDFATFLADVGERPSPIHQIERKDNDGHYEPSNVVWATPTQQGRNKRNNVILTFQGRSMCLSAWAEEIEIGFATLSARVRAGWSTERALTTRASLSNRPPRR